MDIPSVSALSYYYYFFEEILLISLKSEIYIYFILLYNLIKTNLCLKRSGCQTLPCIMVHLIELLLAVCLIFPTD